MVYTFSGGGKRFALPTMAYTAPFKAGTYGLTQRSETGVIVYRRLLDPGETFQAILKMPRISLASDDEIMAIKAADYAACRDRTIVAWKALIEGRIHK